MFLRRFHHVLRLEEGAGGSGGAAAAGAGEGAAGAGGAGAAGAGGNDGAAAGAGAGAGTALAAGAGAGGAAAGGAGAGGAAAGGAGGEIVIPEKFVVKGANGEVDHAATALKLAREGYLPLEKRLGSGDAPPANVEGYKVNVPEALKGKVDAEALTKDEGFKGFLAKLHAAGASQKVADAAVAELLERGTALRETMPVLAASECEAELRQQDGWKSDQEYSRQVGLAFNAGKQIFGKDFDGVLKDYGNDPRIIRGLATIGKEMAEDMPPSPEAQAQIQSNLDTLMNSPAYLNAADPQHAATVARVEALTKQMSGSKPVGAGKTITFKT